MVREVHVTVLVGPTGVGKSCWALDYAYAHGSTIINGDSQQCYKGCPILTACPSRYDYGRCPHLGYGVLEAHEQTSVGWWLKQTVRHIKEVSHALVVGGTGLYIDALLYGLSPIPPIDGKIQERVHAFIQEEPRWMERVKACDQALPPTMRDPQRLRRALEVLWQTGQSITEFWKKRSYAVPNLQAHVIVMHMPMHQLEKNLKKRLDHMIVQGAVEEVASLCADPPQSYKGLGRVLGFKHLMKYVKQEVTLHQALEQTYRDTRLYAKRQRTWFHHRIRPGPLVKRMTHVEQ